MATMKFLGRTGHARIECDGTWHWVVPDDGSKMWRSCRHDSASGCVSDEKDSGMIPDDGGIAG